MGIIKKQGIQGSIILYIGVFIGFLTSSVFFPKILSKEEIGLLNTLLSYSIVFAQFSTLGFNSVITRMFSYFRDNDKKHNNFFFFVFAILLVGSMVFLGSFYLLKPFIVSQNIQNSPLFVDYLNYLVPLTIFTLIFFILDNYYTVLFKAVRGIFLKEVLQRVLILFALFLFYIKLYNFFGLVVFYVVALCVPTVILVYTIVIEKEFVIKPNFGFITKDLAKTMLNVGIFGILTSIVGSANIQIDKVMASSMLSLEATGIYSTVFIFATLIKVPSRALLKIASAILADAWKVNDLQLIGKVYKETSFNQYIIGLLVFIGLWANIDNIFWILPQGYEEGKYVILFLGIAYTFEMATGASNNIIATSRYFKALTWIVAIMLIVAVILNLLFVPLFKINGLALATSISVITFTLIKIVFIYAKFSLNPFDKRFILLTIIGITSYLASLILPDFSNLIFNILVKSAFITFLYLVLLYLSRISIELNESVHKILKLIQSKNKPKH